MGTSLWACVDLDELFGEVMGSGALCAARSRAIGEAYMITRAMVVLRFRSGCVVHRWLLRRVTWIRVFCRGLSSENCRFCRRVLLGSRSAGGGGVGCASCGLVP
jgi:hypothetical protein